MCHAGVFASVMNESVQEQGATRRCGDGGDPALWVTVTKGVGWMPRSFVPTKDVA